MSFRGADQWKSRVVLQEQASSYPCQEACGPQGKCRLKFASLGTPALLITSTTEHGTKVRTGKLLVPTATASAVQVPGRCPAEWFPWRLPELPLPLQSRDISMPMSSRGLSAIPVLLGSSAKTVAARLQQPGTVCPPASCNLGEVWRMTVPPELLLSAVP